MAGKTWKSRTILMGVGALLLVLGGLAWLERGPLLAWYYLRQLSTAPEANREAWAARVAGLGEAALPGLVELLGRADAQACGNARLALERLAQTWGPDDARVVTIAQDLGRALSHFNAPGQREALALATGWLSAASRPAPASLVPAGARLLGEAAAATAPEVHAAGLELCAALLAVPEHAEAVRPAQDFLRAALRSSSADNRVGAIRLVMQPGMDLLEPVVALLSDPEVVVRRAAMLAVGPARDAVPDECLLPSLHDNDAEVRRLCEAALSSRGLRPECLQLGRLLTHPQPTTRLQVLDHLPHIPDLDPGQWLRRLSHDPSPSVRVAAMRAMVGQPYLDLSDRIDQMARSDPSPTVCQLARYYLHNGRTSKPSTKP